MKSVIHSKVEGGKLSRNRQTLSAALCEYEGKEVTITIEPRKKSRSLPQNAYYWSAVVPIVRQALRDLGHRVTHEETHLMLRGKFLREVIPIGEEGEFIDMIRSTTSLSTSEFNDYLADIKSFALDYLGIDIPEPNQQTTLL